LTTSLRGLSFFFNAHNDVFEEIAKFGLRECCWAEILKNSTGEEETSVETALPRQTPAARSSKQPEVT